MVAAQPSLFPLMGREFLPPFTGVGLVPLALGAGDPGREIQQPMAVVILGGIVTLTFLNMIVIPALYLKYGEAVAVAPSNDYQRQSDVAPTWD